ncbi:MAG: ATP-binding cassette domain-containing protein, partial [Oscillospiraceae bacterium]
NIKTAESKQKQIDRMVKDLKEPEKALKGVSMKFTAKVRSGNDVLEVENESATFDQRILYENLSFSLKRGERAFIIGANGCGKTTLLKAILAHGEKNKFGSMVSVGYFDQHGGNIDKSKTVFGELRDSYPNLSDTEIRNALAMFLFKQEEVFSKIEDLSGGERARVSLCKLMLSGDNLLLLDEPTNHLDLRSRMALENALEGYDGTILAVSHDRYFINKLATKILSLMPTKIETTIGNYDDFLAAGVESSKPEKMLKSESVNKIQYKQKKECQASLRKCENAMLRSEKAIEDFEESIASVETELQSPEVATDYQKTLELSARLHEQNDKLLLEMEVWERLAAELEDLRKMEEQA